MDACQIILGETNPEEFSLPFLLAVMFATAMVVMSTRRRMRRSQALSSRPSSRNTRARTARIQNRAATIRTGNAIEAEASSAMLELQEYSRQVQAQIDNRFQKLEIAAHRADEKIAELRRLIGETDPATDSVLSTAGSMTDPNPVNPLPS